MSLLSEVFRTESGRHILGFKSYKNNRNRSEPMLWIGIGFDVDPDPESTFHFAANLDPTPSFTHVGNSENI